MTKAELIERLKKKINTSDSFLEKTNKKIEERFEKDVNKIIKRAISDFYDSYKPRYYKRKYSLKYMYKLTIKNGEYTIKYSHKYTYAKHRADNKYIFDLVFMKGYHGGAPSIAADKVDRWGEHPNTGIPYWRYPPKPWEDENGEMQPPYTEWGRKAEQSDPPVQRIDEAVDAYEEKFKTIRREIFKEEFVKWLK